MVENSWICLMIHPSYHRKGRGVLESELSRIFGEDLLDLRVVMDEDEDPELDEFYAFIRCKKYFPYVSKLINSTAVRKALPSIESPSFLGEDEVSAFIQSSEGEPDGRILNIGDIVEIKDGYLSGLNGVISDRISFDHYEVTLKFHTRKFSEVMEIGSLIFVDSVFSHLKFPVSESIENLQAAGIQWVGTTGIQFYGCKITSVY